MAGVVDVGRGLAEDHHDLVDGGADAVPALTLGPGVIAPGNGVLFFIHSHQLSQLSCGRL